MKKYVGLKLIQAEPMSYYDFSIKKYNKMSYYDFSIKKYNKFNEESEYAIQNKNSEGYLVQYEDGYISWSPKKIFEKAYKEIDIDNFRICD
jgi:hypothetical protein